MIFKLNDNYDSTILTTELKKRFKVLRIYLFNKYKNEGYSIDLDKEKLVLLRGELNKMIEKL